MITLYGSLRLRPTRIGFVVQPDDRDSVLRWMRLCSCLWGGYHNPIIPVARPGENAFVACGGKRLARGHLEFFEPDVFVEATSGLAREVGVPVEAMSGPIKRVVELDEFVEEDGRGGARFAFGLDIYEVYRHLYRREFQFTAKHERRVARVRGGDGSAGGVEALFGEFPQDSRLDYIRRAFENWFDPEISPDCGETWARMTEGGFAGPLEFTRFGTETYYGGVGDPVIFVFDPASATDLIDLWNFRQVERDVLGVSVEWMVEQREFLRSLVEEAHRPLPGNPYGVMISTALDFGRSIPGELRSWMARSVFDGLPVGAVSSRMFYQPAHGADEDDGVAIPRAVRVSSEEKQLELAVDDPGKAWLRFSRLAPPFPDQGWSRGARWVNVLRLERTYGPEDLAVVLPADYPEFRRIRTGPDLHGSREGLVLPMEMREGSELLLLPRASEAFAAWLLRRGLAATKSEPGRIADQVVAACKGLRGCSILEDEETLRLFDSMARRIRRTATVDEWREVLGKRKARRKFECVTLDDLVEAGVMKLGLTVTCENCSGENWYGLDELGEAVTCDRCRRQFSFPQGSLNFGRTPWAYRVVGPFAVPRLASGSYATVLALRVFATKLGFGDSLVSVSTNLDLSRADGVKLEIDFAVWFVRERQREREAPRLVLGEAKSFGEKAITAVDLGERSKPASEERFKTGQ